MTNALTQVSDALSTSRTRLLLLGVGSAGTRIAEHLADANLEGVQVAVLNTDAEALRAARVPRQVQLGLRLTRGLGAGGDPEVGRAAAEEAVPGLREICAGAEIVVVIAGLGGGTGTGAAPVVARVARESGAVVLGLVALPFDCEGSRRQRQAQRGLEQLRLVADAVLCLPNQRVLSLIDENTSLLETFRYTENLLAQGVRAVWRLAGRPGLIPVDVADLREALHERHAESFFACVESEGEQRARDAVERLLLSPLIENGALLRQATSLLVSIVAGPSLSLAEVNRIMDLLRRECGEADLLMGATIEPALGAQLSLTIIGARRPETETQTLPAPATEGAVPSTVPRHGDTEADTVESNFFQRDPAPRRPKSRYVAPPPELTEEQRQQLLAKRRGRGPRLQQTMLPLEVVSKGRFEKSEPTLYRGEDLDVPTFVRRGMVLN